MSEFASLARFRGFAEIFGTIGGGLSGFQGAHIHAKDLWNGPLKFLNDLNPSTGAAKIGVNFKFNGVLLPETDIGSMTVECH